MFHEFAQDTLNVTVCGVPSPTVRWKFNTSVLKVAPLEKINSYTFKYSMALPVLTQDMCGKNLTFKAKGFLGEEEKISRIFLSNCKCIGLLFIFLFLSFWGK